MCTSHGHGAPGSGKLTATARLAGHSDLGGPLLVDTTSGADADELADWVRARCEPAEGSRSTC